MKATGNTTVTQAGSLKKKKKNVFPFVLTPNAVSEYLPLTSQRYIQNPLPTVTHYIIWSDLMLSCSYLSKHQKSTSGFIWSVSYHLLNVQRTANEYIHCNQKQTNSYTVIMSLNSETLCSVKTCATCSHALAIHSITCSYNIEMMMKWWHGKTLSPYKGHMK